MSGTVASAYLSVPVPELSAAMAPTPMPDSSRHSLATRASVPSSHSLSSASYALQMVVWSGTRPSMSRRQDGISVSASRHVMLNAAIRMHAMAISVRGYTGLRPRPPLRAVPGGGSFLTRSLTCPITKSFFEACASW